MCLKKGITVSLFSNTFQDFTMYVQYFAIPLVSSHGKERDLSINQELIYPIRYRLLLSGSGEDEKDEQFSKMITI